MAIFSILIKENEFYNIKTRLLLELFSVKTLLQPSFALAATITFPKIWPHGQICGNVIIAAKANDGSKNVFTEKSPKFSLVFML